MLLASQFLTQNIPVDKKIKNLSLQQRNWVFATNSDFLIPKSLKYLKSTALGCKDEGIKKKVSGKDSIPLSYTP